MENETTPPAGGKFTICGVLEAYSDQGTEGIIWSVMEDGKKGYDALHCLKDGDQLRILNPDGSLLWEGVIDLEYETGHRPYPSTPENGKQECWGCWVHGNQRGFALDDWGEMFLWYLVPDSKYRAPLRAELIPA